MVILSLDAIKTIATLCLVSNSSGMATFTDQEKCHRWYVDCIDKSDKDAKPWEKGELHLLNKCIREKK